MLLAGEVLDGKYSVVRRLGGDGYGEVYLATDAEVAKRPVAIKVLRGGRALSRDDLIWEMQTLATLDHPGVVKFYHHFTAAGRLCLVMEYCAGGSLRDRLERGPACTENEAVTWVLSLCRTLQAVHAAGIVHHDIKPENILMLPVGGVKLGDFGVANRNTGTVIYMAPEMLSGEPRGHHDPRVDVYALGLTLLETLTGDHPFVDLPSGEAQAAKLAHAFVPADLPQWLNRIVHTATNPAPELRFQTIADFAEALEARRITFAFDRRHLKAHRVAEKAEALLAKRKVASALRKANAAMAAHPDCVAALIAAGRAELAAQRLDRARAHFTRALAVSPRTAVQKELGWLSLESGDIPTAISLLTDHLQRQTADFPAFNLLLKCYWRADRIDAAEELCRAVLRERPPLACFASNLVLFRLLRGEAPGELMAEFRRQRSADTPFIDHNLMVASEAPPAWGPRGGPSLRSKLLFHDHFFGGETAWWRPNRLGIDTGNGEKLEYSRPIITFGRFKDNDVRLGETDVSRRHFVVINHPENVWLHDLGSTHGVDVDGERVRGAAFLEGIHDVRAGPAALRISSDASKLV